MQVTSISQGIYRVSQKFLSSRGNAFKVELQVPRVTLGIFMLKLLVNLQHWHVLTVAFNTAKPQNIAFGENEV